VIRPQHRKARRTSGVSARAIRGGAKRPASSRSLNPRDDRLFDISGINWQVNRERILILGAARSLLMQIAHPLIAAAVDRHSGFREDPMRRLRRTMETMAIILFGTAGEARGAADQLRSIHSGVRGALHEPAGDYQAGTRYYANDPELLFWVHATLVDTSMLVFRCFVRELSAAEQEHYYQGSTKIARLYGIPDSVIPRNFRDFRNYMDRMIYVGPIAVGEMARELAGHILRPNVPMPTALGTSIIGFASVGLMPPKLRDDFGLGWGPARQFVLDASAFASRMILPILPDTLRVAPAARAAEMEAGALGVRGSRRWMPDSKT
jgi:uncharacterized protein (DUF2236 family)